MQGPLSPDLHPTETPPPNSPPAQGWPALHFQCPLGAHLTLFKHVRQTERLWVRQTLMRQGVGEGRHQPANPFPPAQVLLSLPLSQSHRILEPAPQGHSTATGEKEPSEVGASARRFFKLCLMDIPLEK